MEVLGPVAGTPTSQHPDRAIPVLLGPPLLEVEEVGPGTPLDTAAGGRPATTDTAVSGRPAVTTPAPVEATVEEVEEATLAVGTPATVTPPPPPRLPATVQPRHQATVGPRATVTTPTPATPPAGPLELRVSPGLELVGAAQSDQLPGIPGQTPTAETNP